jgi:hypothetical protein
MNTPTHVIAGVVVAQTVMIYRDRHPGKWTGIGCGVVCWFLAAGSHLLLDAIPHYNWIVYMNWLRDLPFHWLIRNAVFAIPMVWIGWHTGRDHWVILGLGLFGGMYPDFEKVAYVDFHIPQQLVLFPGHSLELSGHTGGWPRGVLVAIELALILGCVAATVVLYRRRRPVMAT